MRIVPSYRSATLLCVGLPAAYVVGKYLIRARAQRCRQQSPSSSYAPRISTFHSANTSKTSRLSVTAIDQATIDSRKALQEALVAAALQRAEKDGCLQEVKASKKALKRLIGVIQREEKAEKRSKDTSVAAPGDGPTHILPGIDPSNAHCTIVEHCKIPGQDKYLGGVITADKYIYGIPGHAKEVMQITPDGVVSTFAPYNGRTREAISMKGDYKWLRGVLGPDGCVYGIPCHATAVLKIDPKQLVQDPRFPDRPEQPHCELLRPTYKVKRADGPSGRLVEREELGWLEGNWKWHGGLLGRDGNIYGIPTNCCEVLKIEVATGKVTLFGGLAIDPTGWGRCTPYLNQEQEQAWLQDQQRRAQQDGTKTAEERAREEERLIKEITGCADLAELTQNQLGKAKKAAARRLAGGFKEEGLGQANSQECRRWYGGILGEDGCMYGIPQNAKHVLKVELEAQRVHLLEIPDAKVVHPEEARLQREHLPRGDDVKTDSSYFEKTSGTGALPNPEEQVYNVYGGWKWHGGMYSHADGCIYGVPNNVDTVLRIDPAGNHGKGHVSLVGDAKRVEDHRKDGKYKYLGMVTAANGDVYCIPGDAERVLKIDPPKTRERDPVTGNLIGIAKVYSVGRRFVAQHFVDPADGLVKEKLVCNKWQNGWLSDRDDCIYGIPLKADTVIRIHTKSDHVEEVPIPAVHAQGFDKWEGGVLGADGCMYCMPMKSKYVMRVVPGQGFQPLEATS